MADGLEETEDPEFLDDLRRLVEEQRVYASFREIGPKEGKEIDVVRDLMESLAASGSLSYTDVRPSPKDPPDCLASDPSGGLVAIEVTELVSEEAVRSNEILRRELGRRPDITEIRMAQWSPGAFITHLAGLLSEKDSKALHGGPFEEYVVVVHTADPLLEWRAAERWLISHSFGEFSQISSAYLLFSYHPGIGYPFLALPLR
jgi:hypothetical protein